MLKPGEEVVCLPAHRASDPCTWQAFTAVMSHQRVDQACLGGHVGLNILNLGTVPTGIVLVMAPVVIRCIAATSSRRVRLAGNSRWCAATFMWARIALSISVAWRRCRSGQRLLGPCSQVQGREVMSTGTWLHVAFSTHMERHMHCNVTEHFHRRHLR